MSLKLLFPECCVKLEIVNKIKTFCTGDHQIYGGGLVTKLCLSLVTPWTVAARLLCPWDFPGKNPGVGCHFLLQSSIQRITLFENVVVYYMSRKYIPLVLTCVSLSRF